jgi:carbon-monoxide dehydrogenase small subunit
MLIHTTIDGVARELSVAPGQSLLALLRDELGLVATKNACEQGECGSCSVWLDGEVVCSCLVPAVQADGTIVRTVASLGNGDLHPVQEAFLAAGAVQCGYCTPGMLVAAKWLLGKKPNATRQEIAEALSGQLCRCTGYLQIYEAVEAAAKVMRGEPAPAPRLAPVLQGGSHGRTE